MEHDHSPQRLPLIRGPVFIEDPPQWIPPNPASPLFIPAPSLCPDRSLSAAPGFSLSLILASYRLRYRLYNKDSFFFFFRFFWKTRETLLDERGEEIAWTNTGHFHSIFLSPCSSFVVQFSSSCSLWPAAKNNNVHQRALRLPLLQRLPAGEEVHNERGHAVLH